MTLGLARHPEGFLQHSVAGSTLPSQHPVGDILTVNILPLQVMLGNITELPRRIRDRFYRQGLQ